MLKMGKSQSDFSSNPNPSVAPVETKEIHITSFIVQVMPEHLAQTVTWIQEQSPAEISLAQEDGKIIAAMESESLETVTDFLNKVSSKQDVLNCALVYHQIEESHRLDELIEVDSEEYFPSTPR